MSYDRLKNNVNAINWAIAKNRLGLTNEVGDVEVPVLAEDLSNFVDVGSTVNSSLDADKLKSFAKDVVTGIARNIFITRAYKAETHGIVKNVGDYNGALQRIAMKNLAPVLESNARHLVNGQSYFDGKFYGLSGELDARIFTDEFDFKIPYSIGYEDVSAKFDNIEWVNETIASIEIQVGNALENKLKGIADTILNKAIVSALTANRKIPLVTKFCEYMGYQTTTNGVTTNNYTWAQIKASETLTKQYVAFEQLATSLVIKNMGCLNYKYNDGTVPTFTPKANIKVLSNMEYSRYLNNFGFANIYNEGLIPKENVEEVLCWQSFGEDMLPILTTTGKITDGTFTLNSSGTAITTQSKTDYSNIVKVIYDDDAMGVTYNLNKVGVEEVSAELFRTYHHHFAIRQYLDTRNSVVVFTLE